jgi:hypothetical protein
MARTLTYDNEAIWNVVREESLLQEPPVFHRVDVRGPVAFVWWGLRIYVVLMAALIVAGFLHGLR